jgi:hypothetical protein
MGSVVSIVRSHTDGCCAVSGPYAVEVSSAYLIPGLYGMEAREETFSSLCILLVWLARMLVLGAYDRVIEWIELESDYL